MTGVYPTKAMQWGLGSVLQWFCPTKALLWGLGSVLQGWLSYQHPVVGPRQ